MMCGVGFAGANQEEEVDIVEDWGMDPDSSDEDIDEAVNDWAHNYIEWGWSRKED